ncbi:MAG: hypothetical protein M1269_05100 [Chloroflexi bacterium]|nr:hypothetical protein [Chloroflexota bacterium]
MGSYLIPGSFLSPFPPQQARELAEESASDVPVGASLSMSPETYEVTDRYVAARRLEKGYRQLIDIEQSLRRHGKNLVEPASNLLAIYRFLATIGDGLEKSPDSSLLSRLTVEPAFFLIPRQERKLEAVIWQVTSYRPLDCYYCPAVESIEKRLDLNDVEKHLLDLICEYPEVELYLTGGEPLLSWDLEGIIDTATGLGIPARLDITGMLSQEDRLINLVQRGLGALMVEISGSEKKPEKYPDITPPLALIKNLTGKFPWLPVGIRLVIHKDNIGEFTTLVTSCADSGARGIEVVLAHPFSDSGQKRPGREEYRRLLEEMKVFTMKSRDGNFKCPVILAECGWHGKEYEDLLRIKPFRCPAGSNQATLLPDGRLLQCRRLPPGKKEDSESESILKKWGAMKPAVISPSDKCICCIEKIRCPGPMPCDNFCPHNYFT